MRRRSPALLALAAAVATTATPAQAAPRFEPVDGSYTEPVYLTAPPRDPTRVFVVEQGGLVKVVENGTAQAAPFIDLSDPAMLTTGGERGLLSMAFPPDYATSGLAYTYLTGPGGELQIREHTRMATDQNRTETGSRLVWSHAHPASNHNGGQIHFGPDGMLWLAPGDGGGTARDAPNNAQRLDSQLGKVLRIDPRPGPAGGHTVPPDNPFGSTIWASGLRNPYRFSFDRGTGDLTIGDVGENTREEINRVRWADRLGEGGGFGWRCYEGSIPTPLLTPPCEPRGPYFPPVFDYGRTDGRTVTGGVVVRDPELPTLLGRYLYADFFRAEIRSLALDAPGADPQTVPGLGAPQAASVAAFGEDTCGNVYVVSRGGSVSRLADTTDPECVLKPDPRPLPSRPTGGDQPTTPGGGQPATTTGGAQPATTTGGAAVLPDTRAPSLLVGVNGRRSLPTRRRLRIAVRTDEAASVTVSGRLRGVGPFRTARLSVPAGRRTVVILRISRTTARKLRRTLRRKRVVTSLTISARDAAGNQQREPRRLVIRRR